eukprot:1942110-Rhodomonas_salina.2
MADDGAREGGEDRGPGLDTTLTDADIESNWDQVGCHARSGMCARSEQRVVEGGRSQIRCGRVEISDTWSARGRLPFRQCPLNTDLMSVHQHDFWSSLWSPARFNGFVPGSSHLSVCETFDDMGLREDLLRGIFA